MSVHNRRRVLAPEAREDLRDILLYTEQRWGSGQRRRYRQRLYDAFGELARFPNLGRGRPDLGTDILGFPVGQHVVFYRFTDTQITFTRILHARRDIAGEFGETSN